MVGAQGERMYWNVDMQHHLDHLEGHIQVRDGVKSILQGTVEGTTGLSKLLEGNDEGELFEVELDAQMDDVYMQRIGRFGFPNCERGPVEGNVTFRMTPEDWQFDSCTEVTKDSISEASVNVGEWCLSSQQHRMGRKEQYWLIL